MGGRGVHYATNVRDEELIREQRPRHKFFAKFELKTENGCFLCGVNTFQLNCCARNSTWKENPERHVTVKNLGSLFKVKYISHSNRVVVKVNITMCRAAKGRRFGFENISRILFKVVESN